MTHSSSLVLPPATRRTMYFIGVTTAQSSINAVFPRWRERLQLGECELRGMDFPLQDEPGRYRAAVEFIKHDPLSLGALVTTHKLAVFNAAADVFDRLDPLTRSLGEISSIFKRDGRLYGRTVDPWTSGHALAAFLPPGHWRTGAEVLILGAGGAGTALTWQVSRAEQGADRPARIHVVDRLGARLEHLRQLHASWATPAALTTHLATDVATAGALMSRLPPGSLVVNATGLGKDAPGLPIPPDALFPERGIAWEFNYRGDLQFLRQARAQAAGRKLQVEDGWTYFLHGWTSVIADVFDVSIPPQGPLFEDLGRLAATVRG